MPSLPHLAVKCVKQRVEPSGDVPLPSEVFGFEFGYLRAVWWHWVRAVILHSGMMGLFR